MEKLKTLKDFKEMDTVQTISGKVIEYETKDSCLISKEQLKQESINWIKELCIFPSPSDEVENETYEFMTGKKLKYSEEGKQGIINFIKYFFNITEEDLK